MDDFRYTRMERTYRQIEKLEDESRQLHRRKEQLWRQRLHSEGLSEIESQAIKDEIAKIDRRLEEIMDEIESRSDGLSD